MPFYPITPSTDNRSAKGCTPLVLRNCLVEPQPLGNAKRARHLIVPCMGRTSRVTPASGKNVRGVFSRPGVLGGALFVAAGPALYKIDSAWTATSVGELSGNTGTVLFDNIGANIVLLANGLVYQYATDDSLTQNVDLNCPEDAYTLASLAERALTSQRNSDTFDWSGTGTGLSWPASGFATSGRLPDEIRNQTVLGGDLWHFGANSIQIWRAMGGEDVDAFDILSAVIDRGIIGRDAIAKVDSAAIFVGDDRVVYMVVGYGVARISNREIETKLAALTATEAAAIQCFSYAQGSHLTWVLRMPSGPSFAFDTLNRTWSERATWKQPGLPERFAPTYYTYFHQAGKHVVASDESDVVWTWDEDQYGDAGLPHERIMTVHVPVAQRTIVSSITLDLKCTDVPLTGTGSNPKAQVTFYTDGGSRDSLATRNVERMMALGGSGSFATRPTTWRLGMVAAADGLIIKIRITDPINFAFSGVWVNEDPT